MVLLSIIVPMYNVELYIEKCLRSILPQMTPEVELIVVDDCTPDRSAEIAAAILEKSDANVTLFHRSENGGLSAARNSGLDIAKGQYCWFVDSDDWISENAVAAILESVKKEKPDMLAFNHVRIDEDGKTVLQSTTPPERIEISSLEQRLEQVCEFLKNKKLGFEVWRKVYSLDLIREKQLRFQPNKEVFAEDICFNLYYLHFCKNIVTIEDCLYNYLLRGTSIMGMNSRARLKDMHNLTRNVYAFSNLPIVRENFHLVYAGVMELHYRMASWDELVTYVSNSDDAEFVLKMCNGITSNLSGQLKYFGRNNGVRQYINANVVKTLLQGKKTTAKGWYQLRNLLENCNQFVLKRLKHV